MPRRCDKLERSQPERVLMERCPNAARFPVVIDMGIQGRRAYLVWLCKGCRELETSSYFCEEMAVEREKAAH